MQHTTERIDCQENGRIVTESGYLTKGLGLHVENELRESRGVLSFTLNAQSTLRRPLQQVQSGTNPRRS